MIEWYWGAMLIQQVQWFYALSTVRTAHGTWALLFWDISINTKALSLRFTTDGHESSMLGGDQKCVEFFYV